MSNSDQVGMVISIVGAKGGSGKSTLAFQIASEMMSAAHDISVGLIDIDKKPSTYKLCQRLEEFSKWVETGSLPDDAMYMNDAIVGIIPKQIKDKLRKRGRLPVPEYHVGNSTAMRDVVEAMRRRNDITIVDTGGGDTKENRAVISFSDLVIVPFLPSILDMDSMPETETMVGDIKAGQPKLKVKSVINEKPTSSNDFRSKQLSIVMNSYPVLKDHFRTKLESRVAYKDSLLYGLGVCDWVDSKAKGQVSCLVKEIIEVINDE